MTVTIKHHSESSFNSLSRPQDSSRALFPVEIIEHIISLAWGLPLRTNDRIKLFTSLCLVNRTWLNVFIRTALTDVHITGENYARHYRRLLRTRASWESNDDYLLPHASETANTLCRSITFHVDARANCAADAKPAIKLYSAGDSASGAISSTFYMLNVMQACIPNLRKIAIEYCDWGFDDIFDQHRLMPFPKQVTDLQVRFQFSPWLTKSPRVLRDLRRRYELQAHAFGRFAVPNVKTLSILGATTSFAAGLLEAAQGAETVIIDEHVELPVVPEWIQTVVFKDNRSRADRRDVRSEDWLVAARGVSSGLKQTCTPEMMALLYPIASQSHERARRRLRTFCKYNSIRVVDA